MLPFRQTGLTVAVTEGTPNVAITQQSAVVLVTNTNTTWGYFSTMLGADSGTWPPVITTTPPPPTTTNPIPAAGLGVPIPPNGQVQVAVPGNADHYAAQGVALLVTPIEILRSM